MSTLTIITLVIILVVVVVLVVYLVAIILALRRAAGELERLAGGLQKIVEDTTPLKDRVGAINGALGQLREGLRSVDRHLVGVARAMKL